MTAVKEKAYAKINLYLDVTRKREDGFHDIKTVMHSVSLHDDIVVSVAPSRALTVKMLVEGNKFLPLDSKNLAYQAALLFFDRLGARAEVKIKLVKRIPVAAGLAGGSSDAAAVLRALNKIYKRPFTVKALLAMGAELGSDVPYCIMGKTMLCAGRGEKMLSLGKGAHLNIVIASAAERISAAEAYGVIDDIYFNEKRNEVPSDGGKFEIILGELESGEFSGKGLYNIFEPAVLQRCPKSAALRERLVSLGAIGAMMSGSGPAVFGIFDSVRLAVGAKDALLSEGFSAWLAKSV